MKKSISYIPLFLLFISSSSHAASIKDVAMGFCQINYDKGSHYFGQPGERHSSWQSCVDKKMVEYATKIDPSKNTYQPSKANSDYAKRYCGRSAVQGGRVVYGGLAEAPQPGSGQVNLNAFSSYQTCIDRKTKEHFYGSEEFQGEKPYQETTPEERAAELCANSKEEGCYEKKLKEMKQWDQYIDEQKRWLDYYGDDFAPNEYEKCIERNDDCGGKIPVSVGNTVISTQLLQKKVPLGGNCALLIDYFNFHLSAENKAKVPDGRVFDFGDFAHGVTQDYLYTIVSVKNDKKHRCPNEGKSWFPDTSSRDENITIAGGK